MRKKLQVHIKINKLLKSRHNLSAEEKTKVVDLRSTYFVLSLYIEKEQFEGQEISEENGVCL